MSSTARGMSLYVRGLHALDRVLRPPPNRYVCPICVELFWSDQLTREHAPPASIGGRVVCLTCSECNSTGGHKLDAAMMAERRFHGFMHRSGESYDALLTYDSIHINVEVSRTDEGTSIVIPGDRNDPKRVEELRVRFPEVREMKLTHSENYTRRRADVAYLRAAYLIAFAKLGYRYVFLRTLGPVRSQIRNPDEAIVPICRTYVHDVTLQGRYLLTMSHPVECLGVVIDASMVFLPYGGGDMATIQDWLESGRANGGPQSLTSQGPWSWPRGSEFDLDYHGRILNRGGRGEGASPSSADVASGCGTGRRGHRA